MFLSKYPDFGRGIFCFWVDLLITFSVGAVLLILGIGLFNLGADLAMTPMGTHVGAGLSRQKKLGLLLSVCFVLGMLITIAEPDLQVLVKQVSAVMNGTVLIYAVGLGVGAWLDRGVLPCLPALLPEAAQTEADKNRRWRCIYIFGSCHILDRC